MKEYRQIVQMWRDGTASVLVTLVKARGSSYRMPGACLLLGAGNDYVGTVSGGCLEAEVIRKAAWLVRHGAVVERYSTLFDDTAEIPFGMGCGGVVDLLFEPTGTAEFQALMLAMEQAIAGQEATILTWLPEDREQLARAVLSTTGDFLFASESLSETQLTQARASVLYGLTALPEAICMQRLVPPQRLYVLGAGDDAKPLVTIAALLGWNVTVMDGRPQLARPERFPAAESVSVLRSEALHIQRRDAVVLMTHSYEQDRNLLASVLPLRPRYLGILGARHRTSLLISEVAARLGHSVSECCEQIQAPVGLNLGGDGPEAIALAVIAEIQACVNGRLANSRKLSADDVENYIRESGSPDYAQARCALDAG